MTFDDTSEISPNKNVSLWKVTTPKTDFSPLLEDRRVDIAVIGGGITGLTTAYLLCDAGREVALVEANDIADGTSGNTTGKVTSQHGLIYDELLSNVGYNKARMYAEANEAAIDQISSIIDHLNITANFERLPAYLFTESKRNLSPLRKEFHAARQLGLPAEYVDSVDIPFQVAGAIRFEDQAQFHPRRYLLALVDAIVNNGGEIFESTRAVDLTPGQPNLIETTGGTISADHVVIATHFPFFDRGGYFARMHPSWTYLLAAETADQPPDGMFLSMSESKITFRPYCDEQNVLIIGGQGHMFGHNDLSPTERFNRCEQITRRHFSVGAIHNRWSAHDYRTIDRIPFIGKLGPFSDTIFIGAGFNKWGLTGGTVAGMILSDLIDTGDNPWSEVFDPMRISLAAGQNFLDATARVSSRFVGDRLRSWMPQTIVQTELPQSGEGKILRCRGRPMAIHRDEQDNLITVSAVCPHMWCLVEWNNADKTWDCPCHGSRFNPDGSVIHGPAVTDLPQMDL